MTHLLVFIATAALGLYAMLTAFLWRFQEQIVFQPPPAHARDTTPAPARMARYRSTDDVELMAWIVGECDPTTTVVLAFHGNAELARWLVPWATVTARDANACVVVPEYRGYDGLKGKPSYEGSALDARAALAFVRNEMNVSPSDVVYFGYSLGSAIATELATYAPPRALVLESPFSSAREMSRRFLAPALPGIWQLISRICFDTESRVRALDTPVWIAHGDRDALIPVRMGRAVFAAAKRKGELLIVAGAGHTDVAEIGGAEYRDWLRRAIGSQRRASE